MQLEDFHLAWVEVFALRTLRPRSADGTNRQKRRLLGQWIAPLDAALLVAARRVLPHLKVIALSERHLRVCSIAESSFTLFAQRTVAFSRVVQFLDRFFPFAGP